MCVKVNMKANKVDPRVERPEAAGGDWVFVGDVPDSVFSVVTWFTQLNRMQGERRPDAPFFLDADGRRAYLYLYKHAVANMRALLGRVLVGSKPLDASVYAGHGLRVA